MSEDLRQRVRELIAPAQERSIEQLRATLSMLTHFVWSKQLRPGEHMWSIPVDRERDFDCILSDAIDELKAWRDAASLLDGECSTQEHKHD